MNADPTLTTEDLEDLAEELSLGRSFEGHRTASHRKDRDLEEYPRPDVNPYLRQYLGFGPPVIRIDPARAQKGSWAAHFGRVAPLHVEIGSGNGHYLAGMAALHPEHDWLGIEIRFKRIVLTARKIQAAGIQNARIARFDAFFLEEMLGEGEVAGFHVHHPDPWPKERHQKYRLMARPFAERIARMLEPGGFLRMKTDHRANIDRLVDSLQGLPLRVEGRSEDYDRDGPPWPVDDDILTTYQEKFRKRGLPVYAVLIRRLQLG